MHTIDLSSAESALALGKSGSLRSAADMHYYQRGVFETCGRHAIISDASNI